MEVANNASAKLEDHWVGMSKGIIIVMGSDSEPLDPSYLGRAIIRDLFPKMLARVGAVRTGTGTSRSFLRHGQAPKTILSYSVDHVYT